MTFSVVYLHGFASGPDSAKASYFRNVFQTAGIPFVAPDLNAPSFRELTLSRTVAAAEAAAPGGKVCVIGSSLGGYAAALWAAKREAEGRPLAAGMLIAPAFEASRLWRDRMSESELATWRKSGVLTLKTPTGQWLYGPQFAELDSRIYEDALAWDAEPLALSLPLLIFHGEADATVPVSRSRTFAEGRNNVTLHVFPQAPHGLVEQVGLMADKTLAFFYSAVR